MRAQAERERQTVEIASALGVFAVVLLVAALVAWLVDRLVDRHVGVLDGHAETFMWAAVLVATALACWRLRSAR